MRCPHCDYLDSTPDKEGRAIPEKHGYFYRSENNILRRLQEFLEYAEIIGCPKCLKTFIKKR